MVYGDVGYQGLEKREETADERWTVRLGSTAIDLKMQKDSTQWVERAKAHVRAKVEHPLPVLKQQFGFQKTRLRSLSKTTAR